MARRLYCGKVNKSHGKLKKMLELIFTIAQ